MLIIRIKKPLVLSIPMLVCAMFSFLIFAKAGTVFADQLYTPSDLISDPLFNDSRVMSASDIQNFLNSENSGIRNLTDTEACSPTTPTLPDPYAGAYYHNCGSTQSSAQIIYDAAQAYGISPRVILATMQKEESLVTDPTPWQQNSGAVNCAMGYLSCGSVSGFFNQVDNGTWQLRTYIELMNGRSWWGYSPSSYPCASAGYIGPTGVYNSSGQQVQMRVRSTGLYPGATVTFDNPAVYDSGGSLVGGKSPPVPQTITLANSSTAALYCYTPYVGPYSTTGYSGSYNFVQSYESWWGSTIGEVLSTPGGGIYKFENNTKRPFPNEITFYSYGYLWPDVVYISPSEMSQIADGAVMPYNVHYRDGHLVSVSGGIYDIYNGTNLPFPSEITFYSYGFKWTDAIPISSAELAMIPGGGTMSYNVHYRDGHLVTADGNGIYDVYNGQKLPFPNDITFLSYNFKWSYIMNIGSTELSLIPTGSSMSYNVHYRDGHLVTADGNGIYDVYNGQKLPFPNYATFISYGYKSSDVLTISATELSYIPTGPPMKPKQ